MIKKVIALVCAIALGACQTPLTPAQSALLTNATNLAQIAVTAAVSAKYGSVGSQLASNGLYALSSVLQSFVGHTVPTDVIQNTPGIPAIGDALAKQIAPNRVVSQADADAANRAAAIAATLKPVLVAP